MPNRPAPGTTWSIRLWLFIVCLCSTISLLIYRELNLAWYLKAPLGIVILHAYVSAGIAFRGSYIRSTDG